MLLSPAVDSAVLALQKTLEALGAVSTRREAIVRAAADAAAGRFHLGGFDGPPPVVVLGGTGTGKSTIINRILEADVCAASYRRTFTAGAVAVVARGEQVPPGWLGIEHRIISQADLPACGAPEALMIALHDQALCSAITLVDSPDLDGDRPAHHAQADRAFRWARAVVFVVTPEKYQMTELLPYYRLAHRYGLGCLFVMNKCEETAVVEDYLAQLGDRQWPDAKLFVIPRDDAAYEAPAGADLPALREALRLLAGAGRPEETGLSRRLHDLVSRTTDQVLAPLRDERSAVDRLLAVLRDMQAPSPGVDVSPVTAQLQRRLQQRSILYLIGPQRVLDRVRQLPTLLMRLPRGLWDTVLRGQKPALPDPEVTGGQGEVPDFGQILAEQFQLLHSRLDDMLRSNERAKAWIESAGDAYKEAWLPPQQAADIAADELAQLRQWLEKRWGGTPRDTAILMKLLKYLPGGEKLAQWTEAAPYLLAVIVAAHGAVFGHLDLLILGSYSLATWLTEKLSNEVAGRTRSANRRMTERFEALAKEQIKKLSGWIEKQAPSAADLTRLERDIGQLAGTIPAGHSVEPL